jgi:dUTP pyrophosphatase
LKEPVVKIRKLKEDAIVPKYMTDAAAGMDLYSANDDDILLLPGRRALVSTGIAIALPKGFEAQIRPRSGLAIKHGVTLVNSPGTIDADYRGEIMAIMINLGDKAFVISKGLRIAQMIIGKVYTAKITISESLDETKRGSGGFGHTGHD